MWENVSVAVTISRKLFSARLCATFRHQENFDTYQLGVCVCVTSTRSVQLSRQLDDCTEHQAEPLHGAWPAEWHSLYLLRQGYQPGGKPQQ